MVTKKYPQIKKILIKEVLKIKIKRVTENNFAAIKI